MAQIEEDFNPDDQSNAKDYDFDHQDEDSCKKDEMFKDKGELAMQVNHIKDSNELETDNNIGQKVENIFGQKINIATESEDYSQYPCVYCNHSIDISSFGMIICPKCDTKNHRRDPKININEFETIVDKETSNLLKNVIARINNNLIKRNYQSAYKFCQEAEILAPREPVTWRFYTLAEFYFEISKGKGERKKLRDIIRIVHDNLEICKANNLDNENLEAIKAEIGNNLFNLVKSKIGTCYSRGKRKKGYWSSKGRQLTITYLRIFEDCYRLTGNPIYLKGYVDELSKPFKWLIQKEASQELINLKSCGKDFNAALHLQRMISRIQKIDENYIPPKIENERMFIEIESKVKKIEEEKGLDDGSNGIKILSIQ